MSSIHDLIAKLCPSGVCFKRLGDVARIKNGKDGGLKSEVQHRWLIFNEW